MMACSATSAALVVVSCSEWEVSALLFYSILLRFAYCRRDKGTAQFEERLIHDPSACQRLQSTRRNLGLPFLIVLSYSVNMCYTRSTQLDYATFKTLIMETFGLIRARGSG